MKATPLLSPASCAAGMLLALCAALGGCSTDSVKVEFATNPDVAALNADDIAVAMRQAGFTDAEILDLGPQLRNALAQAGAAKVRQGEKVEAIFAVDGPVLHISSRRTGSHIFDLQTRLFR